MPNAVEPSAPADPAAAELGAVLQDYMDVARRLQQTHEALQREISRLRRELASKDRELELRRRLAALGELAAGLAHEVRNPLGAIALYSNLLRRECHDLKPALGLIEKIEVGIQAIDGVVQDALSLAPRGTPPRPQRLRTIVAAAADNSRQRLDDRGVRLVVELADPDVSVLAEPDSLQRVLVNLIVNGAEASQPGTVVTVTAEPVRDGEVTLRVCDQGSGLSDEVLERLFDPFFTTKETGTGLGLTIAHRLVETHGGRLTAANRPEGGAVFTVVLPAAPAAAEQGVSQAAREFSAA